MSSVFLPKSRSGPTRLGHAGAQALSYLKKFGSVTVLNGHIHQVMQKVEGNVTFHTAHSTAFPQPAPGTAPSPGPMKVQELRKMLGITNVTSNKTNSTSRSSTSSCKLNKGQNCCVLSSLQQCSLL
jgi:hypothetical protein